MATTNSVINHTFIQQFKGYDSAHLEKVLSTIKCDSCQSRLLKQYIRIVKNREAAQRSRAYRRSLETRLDKLDGQLQELHEQFREHEIVNRVLYQEYLKTKELIRQCFFLSPTNKLEVID